MPAVDALSDAMHRARITRAAQTSPAAAVSSASPEVGGAKSPVTVGSPSHTSIASTASLSSSASTHPLSPSMLSALDEPHSASPPNSGLPSAASSDNETDELYGDLSSASAFFASPPPNPLSHHSHYLHAGLPPLPILPPDLRSIVKSLQVISSELRLDKTLPALIAIITQQAGAARGIMLSKADEVSGPKSTKPDGKRRDEKGGGSGGSAGEGGDEGAEEAEWVVEASTNGEVRDGNGELSFMPPSPLGATATLTHSFASSSTSAFHTAASSRDTSAAVSSAIPLSPTPPSLQQQPSLSSSNLSQPAASAAAALQVKPASAPAGIFSATDASSSQTRALPQPLSTLYPVSVVQYCIRSKKSVLLSDALSDSRFGRDPYIIAHSIRSILCTPLLHRDKLVSILYLESGAGNAFTSDRLVVCRLLCQQAAISIDNARLYAQLARNNELLELKVAQRTRELEEATRLANEANRMKSSFLANMSHEIRTPMNGVLGGASLLVETSNNLTVEQKEIVHIIRTSGEVMLTLINDILDLSKIEAGRVELDCTVFSLRGCIEGALDVLAEKASRKHVELLYSAAKGVADMVVGDALRLRQIVINLLSNAVKFTDQGEVLLYVETVNDDAADHSRRPAHSGSHYLDTIASTFSAHSFPNTTAAPITSPMPSLQRIASTRPHLPGERPHLYHIAVRDSGIGISQKALPNLFQSFSQVSSKEQQRHFGGTGLGLSISRQLCELMGGRMWVESEEGVGSVFHFTFRLWASEEGSPNYLQGVATELAGKRMLLVKGSERPASMIAAMCEQWGMHTTLAHNVAEVEAALEAAEHIDVVLVDYELDIGATTDNSDAADGAGSTSPPTGARRAASGNDANETDEQSAASAQPTGLDVAQLVRRLFPSGQSPSVLMLCALSQRQRSMRTVVDAFLSKPVKPSKLFAALVAAQRPKLSQVMMAAGSTSPVLNAGAFPPLAPLVGWPSLDGGATSATIRQSAVLSKTTGSEYETTSSSHDSQSNPMQNVLYMQQQQQQANGKRKRDSGAENSSVSPPASLNSLATSSSTAPASASPSYPSSVVASPATSLFTRHPKPGRLSSGALSSSMWSPPATSTSPVLGEDSRHFFAKHPMRILAAEDNLINQKVLARMLDRLGYPAELVTIVPNGRLAWDGVLAAVQEDELASSGGLEMAKAVRGDSDEEVTALGQRLRHEPYHLVFMDIFMPLMDGLEATIAIRSDARIAANSQPYVIALTANAMSGDKQKCLESGMEFFLSKPVTLGPLMQALRTGYANICKKSKQLLARQQREDGSRHVRQDEAGDSGEEAAGIAGAAGSGAFSEGWTAGAELRRRGVEQNITSPSVRPSKLAQLGSGTASFGAGPSSSMFSAKASPRSATARLSSAAAGTSPSSASLQAIVMRPPPQSTGELPSSLSFARISSAPLSVLTGRMLATSQQLQLLANMSHSHAPPSPAHSRDGERSTHAAAGGGGQREAPLVSSTPKALTSSVPTS